MVELLHLYRTTGKTIAFTRQTFVGKVISLLFNMLSMLVIAFLQGASVFNFMAAVTICSDFGAQENTICHCSPIYFPWSDGTGCHDLCFLNIEFQASFFTLLFYLQETLVPLHFLPEGWYHLCIWGCLYLFRQSLFQLVIHPAWNFIWCTLHIS